MAARTTPAIVQSQKSELTSSSLSRLRPMMAAEGPNSVVMAVSPKKTAAMPSNPKSSGVRTRASTAVPRTRIGSASA